MHHLLLLSKAAMYLVSVAEIRSTKIALSYCEKGLQVMAVITRPISRVNCSTLRAERSLPNQILINELPSKAAIAI